ncbi:hypothetical protein [Streptomyces niveus]|uniref:hypothetical protein n=1 Tax=Streptomyces niveus TaxID=193462 RepID=UPI0033B29D44
MTTTFDPAPAPTETDDGDSLTHIWCCTPERALCGVDLVTSPEGEFEDANCIVCLDLFEQPCPHCGRAG